QRLREQTGVMFVVADTRLRYLAPARLDDLLTITVEPEPAGRASLVVHQRALRGDTLLCEGEIRIGCVRAHDLKPQRLPDAVAAAMSA
ncbi:acyl-CoA thioesterase, partial [Enterobacter ludwigii]|uniref:acyl-CoA thioesterase n=2 Tax=Enterobacterales TaxID=91347 RepID=UPI001EF928AC